MSNLRIIALFAFIILCWGLAWPVNKIGLAYMSPLWYTVSRLVVGTITMMGLVMAVKKFSLPNLKDYPLILVIGFLQISFYTLLANIGLLYLPAGRSSLLAYTTPLWIMPAATIFFKEKASWLSWLGFFFALGGLIVLLSPWEMDWTNVHTVLGSIVLLLASLCWAISMLCARYMQWSKSPLELIPWQLLFGTIPILIFAWVKEPTLTIHWTPTLILSLVYTGIIVTGLSYWSGLVLNRELPTIVVSLGFLAVPVFSLIVSAFFMNETISLPSAGAMTAILLGLICVTL